MGIWPDWTWGDVSVSIAEYYTGGWWWDGSSWEPLNAATVMVAGQEYIINVSQDCTLSWLDYRFDLVTGSNTIVWEPAFVDDITAVIPLTLTIPPSEVEDIVAIIPLTLTIPSIEPPPPPPEDDWWAIISQWLTENWYAAVAVIIIFLIGVFVWARYK